MEKTDPVSAKVDVAYYISMALKRELSWNALAIFLVKISTTDIINSTKPTFNTIIKTFPVTILLK